jgi:hypothetical protein
VGIVLAPLFGFLFSTQMVIWVAVGGRGTIIGPIIGAIGLSFVTSELSVSYPTEWALFLGLLFVAVVVFVPTASSPRFCARGAASCTAAVRPGCRFISSPPRRPVPSCAREASRSASYPRSSSPTARSRC